MNVVYLDEMRLARDVTRDFPEAIKKLDKCKQMLYNDCQYIDVAVVVRQIEESKLMMETILELYTQVLKGIKANE